MKKNKGLLFRSLIVAIIISCTPQQVKTVNTVATEVVDIAQFACLMATPFMTSQEAVTNCGIVKNIADATPGLLQFIDTLIEQREALKKSGYIYNKPAMRWMK